MIATLFRNTFSLAIAATATLLVVAGSAAPVGAETMPTAQISIKGIDLTSPAGIARVTDEVRRTARRLCSTNDDRSPSANQARRNCMLTAIAAAKPQLQKLADAQRDARAALADANAPTAQSLR
jgi:UrcA family protein